MKFERLAGIVTSVVILYPQKGDIVTPNETDLPGEVRVYDVLDKVLLIEVTLHFII